MCAHILALCVGVRSTLLYTALCRCVDRHRDQASGGDWCSGCGTVSGQPAACGSRSGVRRQTRNTDTFFRPGHRSSYDESTGHSSHECTPAHHSIARRADAPAPPIVVQSHSRPRHRCRGRRRRRVPRHGTAGQAPSTACDVTPDRAVPVHRHGHDVWVVCERHQPHGICAGRRGVGYRCTVE